MKIEHNKMKKENRGEVVGMLTSTISTRGAGGGGSTAGATLVTGLVNGDVDDLGLFVHFDDFDVFALLGGLVV